jgi:hypothetical protein
MKKILELIGVHQDKSNVGALVAQIVFPGAAHE